MAVVFHELEPVENTEKVIPLCAIVEYRMTHIGTQYTNMH